VDILAHIVLAASHVWKVKIGLFVLSVIVYAFINHYRRKKLIAKLELDPRISASFTGATHVFPAPHPVNKCLSGWLWLGIFGAVGGIAGAVLGSILWLILFMAGVGLALFDYFVGIDGNEAGPVAEAIFHRDHLILVGRDGQREIYIFGPAVTFTLQVKELTKDTTFGAEELQGFSYSVIISDGERTCELPLEFDGAGEFLARCRHEGSLVDFAPSSPAWFVTKMQDLPSWQSGFFDQPVGGSALVVELSCQGCGGVEHYPSAASVHSCRFCGSKKLTQTSF
jgi:hypothetical protein